MKAAYVLSGGPKWPNGTKLNATPDGPTKRLYYEARDPQVDLAFATELRRLGYEVGTGFDPNWTGYAYSPERYAAMIRDARARIGGGPLLPDVEIHDPAFVLALLTELRRLLPGVNTCWTFESFQGGWIDDLADLITLCNDWPQLRLAPQYYKGDMTPIAGDTATRDLIRAGIQLDRLVGFYPLRDQNWYRIPVPSYWDGILYIEGWELLPG